MVYMTDQQKKIMSFIRSSRLRRGHSPSYSEIAEHMGLHKGAIQSHLQALVDKGVLVREKFKHRSITPVDHADEPRRLPLFGTIRAGLPQEEEEIPEELDPVEYLTQGRECFMLRVRGDSMIDAHIQEEDLVSVDPRKRPRDGDVVVALVDGQSTLKRYRKKGSTIYLEAANARMTKPIVGHEGQVQGVVIALLRQL